MSVTRSSKKSQDDDSDYAESLVPRRPMKRRKIVKAEPEQDPILEDLVGALRNGDSDNECSFGVSSEPQLDDFVRARKEIDEDIILSETDEAGTRMRTLRPSELTRLAEDEVSPDATHLTSQNILKRKAKMIQDINRRGLQDKSMQCMDSDLAPLQKNVPEVNPEVLDALYNIRTTPYTNSFLSRLHGPRQHLPPGLLAVDWETRTPWMDLMSDIRDHFAFAHPERDPASEAMAPITYCTLSVNHLPQVHDLLERSFWPGIDVSDSLDHQPEQATVVAMYKKITVGVAIMKSPRETYIMYLAVKAGWEKAQIARTMLYHLITLNPGKDITLHVSTNNSAMLLYNQFGFKAEEFVAGFYAQYLDPQSRLSNNAFKLRLRHLQDDSKTLDEFQ